MKKYQIIYADPPWQYDFCKDNSDKIENHYTTMSLNDIKLLKIPADNNAVLFLWATAPKLEQALEVMKSWDFIYKTHLVWDKAWIGMGYWFRGRHELLLVGVKGRFSPPTFNWRIPSVYVEKRTKHSKKPDYIRNWIKESFNNYSRLELFARQQTPGWDTWGNECFCDINLDEYRV